LLALERVEAGGRQLLACSDLTGVVTFLDAGLRPVERVDLGTRLQGVLFYAPLLPTRWGLSGGMFHEEAPALIVCDAEGFIHHLSIPGERP
jgi:hypothetical protein